MEGLVARLVSPRSLQQVTELKAGLLAGPAPRYPVGAGTRLRELFTQHDSMREVSEGGAMQELQGNSYCILSVASLSICPQGLSLLRPSTPHLPAASSVFSPPHSSIPPFTPFLSPIPQRIAHLVEEAGDAMCSTGQWGEGVAGGSGGEDEEGGTVVDGEESESAGSAKQKRRQQQEEEERQVTDWMNSLLSCTAADAETSKLQAMLRAVKAEKLKVRFKSHPWPLPTSPSLLAPASSPSSSSTIFSPSSSSSSLSSTSAPHQPSTVPLSHHLITVHAFQDAAFRRYQQLMR
ncbi:unnamed protein product [Closterium sp. NIES-54]